MRFRESQTATIDEHFNKHESTKSRIELLYSQNTELADRIREMKQQRASQAAQLKEKAARNDALKARLLERKRTQEHIALEMERLRGQKTALTTELGNKTERTQQLRQECEKLRPYASQSTPALQAQLAELQESLSRDHARIDALEKRARALNTSSDTFALAANDVQPCITLLAAVAADLAAEEQEAQEAAKRRDALAERGNVVREVERTEAMLQRQLGQWAERTEALRRSAAERAEAAAERMKELREVQRRLGVERGERGREVERRRVKIEQTEKKVRFVLDWQGGGVKKMLTGLF